jgi:hypothetical protein
VGPDGKHHSKEPIPKERAEAQMKALYSAMRREDKAMIPTAREEEAIERKMEGGSTQRFIASLPPQFAELFSDHKEGSGKGDRDKATLNPLNPVLAVKETEKDQTVIDKLNEWDRKLNSLPAGTEPKNIPKILLEELVGILLDSKKFNLPDARNIAQLYRTGEIRTAQDIIARRFGSIHSKAIVEKVERSGEEKTASGRHSLHGSGPIPELSILQQIAKAAYSTSPPQQIGPFKLLSSTPTLKFYGLVLPSNPRDIDTIVVGIRGTNTSDKQDLWADAQLALGRLESTPRWKKDLADFNSFVGRQSDPDGMDIYGVGHSLGGAVLDMFLKKNLIQQGVSYNPAIQLGDADKDLNNRRIYQDGDPLLAIMGRSAKNVEIRPKKPISESFVSKAARYVIPFYGVYKKAKGTLDAHALDNFIGGTHRKNVIKKLGLQDEGHSLAELAKASGIPRKTLQEVYNRGIGAYSTQPSSVRMKGTFKKGVDAPMSQKLSKEQWAMARVYSFIDGNPKHDTDLRGGGLSQSRVRHWLDKEIAKGVEPVDVQEDEQDIMTKQEFKDGDKVVYRISGTSKNGTFINVNTLREDYPEKTFAQFVKDIAGGSPDSVWRVGTVVIIPKDDGEGPDTDVPLPQPVVRPTDMRLPPSRSAPPPPPRASTSPPPPRVIPPPPPRVSYSPPSSLTPANMLLPRGPPRPRTPPGSPTRGLGRGKKVCMPKTEYHAEHEQLTDVLARPTPAKLRKELAKQTAEVKMRGGADEDPQPRARREPKRVSRMRQGSKLNPNYKPFYGPSPPLVSQLFPDPRGPRRHPTPLPPPRRIPTPTIPSNPSDDVELDPTDSGSGRSGYLRKARANAKAYGLDPKKLQLGDGKHKLSYDGVGFGLKSYKDFLLWSDEEKAGRVPKGTAEKKRKAYLARATKIKGDWKQNKVSPNNLAIHILWGA